MNPEKGLKKTAVLCVLRNNDRFLLLKRFREPNKDQYTPVGGKLDPFESPADAAIRETKEETGIYLDSVRYCGVLVETSPSTYNWVSFVYQADIDCIPPPECTEGILEWVAYDEVLSLPIPKADWYMYQYILSNRPFAFSATYDADWNLLTMTDEWTGGQLV